MPLYAIEARYCTSRGRPGRWIGTVPAQDISTALDIAQRRVLRRAPGATKIDVHAVLTQPSAVPGNDTA